MTLDAYHMRWLTPADARAMAKLESCIYPRIQRAGRVQIRERLEFAQQHGTGLSTGLFVRSELVGYMHLFVAEDAAEIWSYYGDEPPEGLSVGGPTLFVDDYVVLPEHRRASGMLALRTAAVARNLGAFRELPLCAFSTAEYRDFWRTRTAALARIGWILAKETETFDEDWGSTLHWLTFRQVPEPVRDVRPLHTHLQQRQVTPEGYEIGLVTSLPAWETLAPHWQSLLSAQARVFDTSDYLLPWFLTAGIHGRLALVVALRSGTPVAILPAHITLRHDWGLPDSRCLEIMGFETQRARLLCNADAEEVPVAVARYLLDQNSAWDRIELGDQHENEPLVRELQAQAASRGWAIDVSAAASQSWVSLQGTWEQYVAMSPERQRALQKARHALRGREIVLDIQHGRTAQLDGLTGYCAAERRYTSASRLDQSVRGSPILHKLVGELPFRDTGASFASLLADGRLVAASVRVGRNGRSHLLHATPAGKERTQPLCEALMARSIEADFRAGALTRLDLPSSPSFRHWATDHEPRVSLAVAPRGHPVSTARRLRNALAERFAPHP